MKLNLSQKEYKTVKTGEIPYEDIEKVVNAEIDEIEFIIGVPYDNNAEDYFHRRYPVNFALDVYQIQALAVDKFGVALSDSEIKELRNIVFDRGFIMAVENEAEECIGILLSQKSNKIITN